MLSNGIAMQDIDDTDLHRYLQVMAYHIARDARQKVEKPAQLAASSGREVYLRRGTIDELWG